MSNCCASNKREATCPANGNSYRQVDSKTMLHHLKQPWLIQSQLNQTSHSGTAEQTWYFCDSPDCDVVYFSPSGQCFKTADLRTDVGQKSTLPDRTLCYCFDIKLGDYLKSPLELRDYVVQQTKAKNCACDIRNPAGHCCLKDFPKP